MTKIPSKPKNYQNTPKTQQKMSKIPLIIFRLLGYFGQFSGFGVILAIFKVLGGILVIFRFQVYSGHFLGLWGTLVIL